MAPGSRRGRRGISFRVREEMVKGLVRLHAAEILVEKVHHRDPILLREGARRDVFRSWLMGFRVMVLIPQPRRKCFRDSKGGDTTTLWPDRTMQPPRFR